MVKTEETGFGRPIPDTVGGTGRVGIGYQQAEKKYGLFGIVDLSGFNIVNENYTFAALEVHGTWKAHWGQSQINLTTGVFAKELPDIQDDGSGNFIGVKKHLNIGPHIGFKYWRPMTQTIGLQLNGRFYSNIAGTAVNGEKISPTISYQIGALGSYRLTKNLMSFAGYAYRQDNAAYDARVETGLKSRLGDVNTIVLEGHYLNFLLEYAF